MKNSLAELEKTLDSYFGKKAPQMPQDIQNVIVNFGPWILFFFLIMSIPNVIGILTSGSLYRPFDHIAGSTAGVFITISWAFTLVILLLEAAALPGLFKKEMKSWRYLYYAMLLSIVQNALSINPVAGFMTALVTGLIGFYVLFQIKHNYS